MFGKFNKTNTVREGIDTSNYEFKALKDFCGEVVKVDGFYFNNESKYGKQLVVVGNGYLINMPKREVENFEVIAKDELMLKSLLEGHLAFTNIRMCDTKNGTTTIFSYTDC